MTLYNYQDFLSLDDSTYTSFEPRFQRVEDQALDQVHTLAPGFDTSKPVKLVHSYCEEVIFITLFGDNLQRNLYQYHTDQITKMEERMRFTTDWMNDKEVETNDTSKVSTS